MKPSTTDPTKYLAILLVALLVLTGCRDSSRDDTTNANPNQASADHGRSNTPDLRRSAGRELVHAPDIEPFNAPPSTGSSKEYTTPQDMKPRTCINLPELVADNIEVDSTPIVDCEKPHNAQIYWTGSLNDDEDALYPGYGTILSVSDQICLDSFSTFVGVEYVESDLEILHLRPDEVAWDRGNRILVCLVQHRHEPNLVGSAEGSRW